ncbi:BPTD_3080 family restriction endonuclease [Jannaschia formosa]|uniref:BPTD_3080 family restriction endonuclease n=1 Tax=Jannaschia formosa TaxID=2259592 RepID=UPI000E1B6AFC|nr:DEAD/DEAH box helicase family protein [Jannaschia formosa]TFL16707.1 restriction endonuclease [Jannaschia formosa]
MTTPNDFFDRPILNSPYAAPSRHWELDEDDRPTHRIIDDRRGSKLATALPSVAPGHRAAATGSLFEGHGHETARTAIDPSPFVERLRRELHLWRGIPDPANWRVSPVTQNLLRHWRAIQADATRPIRPFFCQLEAVEAAIWLAEVAPRSGKTGRWFLDRLAIGNNIALLSEGAEVDATPPDLLRTAFKLATGAGKTTVMAMLIAWQALNAARGKGGSRFSRNFLVVAPGITIKDRLRVLQPNDPQNAYDKIGLIPAELRRDMEKARIVIINFHAFKRRDRFDAASGTRRALEGHGAPLETAETEGEMVQRVVGDMRDIVVLNDEAHHCYRPRPQAEPEQLTGDALKEARQNVEDARLWLDGLEAVARRNGVRGVYDLSATPFFIAGSRWAEGTLFPWVVSDFSLMDAIESGIVKLPRVPVSDNAGAGSVIYRDLWGAVGKKLTRMKKDADPQKLPSEVKTALDALHGHYEKTHTEWRKVGMSIPPVFIVVCSNTNVSRAVRDYIAGYEYTDEDGTIRHQHGALASFRNHDDAGDPLERPNTVLIDSAALESGDAVDAAFKQAHAAEIDAFQRERKTRGEHDPITETDLLREVMNTIGQEGRLGGGVRCVVSVSMLTEGWDANNVTHILGLRAFGSRLLCEQVMGRALRRMSYAPGEHTDPDGRPLFRTEYADIMGIDGLALGEPRVSPPQPPRRTIHVHAVPAQAQAEITFPRVDGYRTDLPSERLAVDLSRLEPYVLTPEKVGPAEVRMAGLIGERHDLTLDHLDDVRSSTIAFEIASYWAMQKLRDANAAPKPHLFLQAKRILREWLDPKNGHVAFKGGTKPAQLLYRQITEEVCDLLMGALVDAPTGDPVIRPVLDSFAPEGSTADVTFHVGEREHMHQPDPRRSHLNWMIGDSGWEVRLAQILDAHPRVLAYAKNHNLGFEVPYTADGEPRRYRPDFLIRLDAPDPTTLIVEVKGFRDHDAMLKAQAIRNRWIPAINGTGRHGRWHFAELRAIHDFRPELDAAIDALLGEEIPA